MQMEEPLIIVEYRGVFPLMCCVKKMLGFIRENIHLRSSERLKFKSEEIVKVMSLLMVAKQISITSLDKTNNIKE